MKLKLLLLLTVTAASLAASQDRILTPIDPAATIPLAGHVSRLAVPQYDRGPADSSMPLSYVTLFLKPDPSIQSFLDGLQTPSSPHYHRFLTPAQFGDRFGLTRSDISKVVAWLESQGLKINDTAQGRHWVTFSGTAGTVGRALHTSIHRYQVNGKLHFANSTEPRIPSALASVVAGFGGLHDFGPQPQVMLSPVQPQSLSPNYNSGGTHYLAPDDFATIYDVSPLYAAGIDGTGQTIVILGESGVNLTDLRAFRTLFKLPAKDPQLVLVGADPGSNGALLEADLDLEWSAAIARNANVVYVYASNVSVAAEYAVDQNLGSVISESYGGCEEYDSPAFRAVAQQANAQGITWFASSGDAGATTCDRDALTSQANLGLTVSSPASIPEITAVGGTSFDDSNGVYWSARNNTTDASVLSYIPERAWNDSRTGFEATGGGASAYYAKPPWQTGPGVPNDGARDLPDISLAASPALPLPPSRRW
jgi:subtilase family serine protease